MGKYCSEKCRPILVKLSRSCDVTSILASRKNLASHPGIRIRPELSLEERSTLSTLLKERRSLINSGNPSSRIHIRGHLIYLNGKRFGHAKGSAFYPEPPLSQEVQNATILSPPPQSEGNSQSPSTMHSLNPTTQPNQQNIQVVSSSPAIYTPSPLPQPGKANNTT